MGAVVAIQPSEESQPVDLFDDFWLLFPRHEAKKDAHKAWNGLMEQEQLAAVVAALDWRRVWQAQARPVDKMPLAGTWLRGERWEDELPQGYRPANIRPINSVSGKPEEFKRGEIPEHVKQALAKLREKR